MRAFLSHSSKDKHFVRLVADALGEAQCEYDERSFEYTLNVEAIHRALNRSDIFVYFLSASSIQSNFVAEELRSLLESRGAGLISKIIIFAIDETSYRALPEWMRKINIAQRLTSPLTCARKIQTALIQLEAEIDTASELYLGRDLEDAAIAKALSGPPSSTPKSIHAVGHYGIGRKTFLKKNLSKLFPRRFATFPELSIAENQGTEELYRQLYALIKTKSQADTIHDFEEFGKFDAEKQIEIIAGMLEFLIRNGEFLVITDNGGVYTEDGDYQDHITQIIDKVDGKGLPICGFVQTRMMPARFKSIRKRSFHQYLAALDNDAVQKILGLTLKQLEVDYNEQQLIAVVELLDGHPFNINFAAAFAAQYGMQVLIADPGELVEWKRKRAEDFLELIQFRLVECDVIAALTEYQFLAPEALFAVLEQPLNEVASAIRYLQEFSCIERRDRYCQIAPPLRDAIRRDKRFARPDAWKQQLAHKMCDSLSDYKDDDLFPVSILDSAVLAAARGTVAPLFISNLILPSHLLRVARDYYDSDKRSQCISFCKQAWEKRQKLPYEAQLEVLRLWGLSAVRIGDDNSYDNVMGLLQSYSDKLAKRIRLFVEGFFYRVKRKYDEAEDKFMQAVKISPRNQSLNRELASLLCKQRRYDEAEKFARNAYEQSPTNPYLIDVMVDVLVGKSQQGLPIDVGELTKIVNDLERYGDAPGSSFYLIRKAQQELTARKYHDALKTVNRAAERTPDLVNVYFIRAETRLGLRDFSGVEEDCNQVRRILHQAGGLSEGEEIRLFELEIRLLLEKQLFRQAKDEVDQARNLPTKVGSRLLKEIAKAVAFDPNRADLTTRTWAATYVGKMRS